MPFLHDEQKSAAAEEPSRRINRTRKHTSMFPVLASNRCDSFLPVQKITLWVFFCEWFNRPCSFPPAEMF
jgi:hypothetical protein